MKREDIKTLEDANAYIDQVEKERDAAIKGKADAEKVAEDAITKANAAEEKAPKEYVANVKGVGKVRVNFGVEGLDKEALVKDTDKLKELVEKGSAAVTLIEK